MASSTMIGQIDCTETNCLDILFWMTISIGILLIILIILVIVYIIITWMNKSRTKTPKSKPTTRETKSSLTPTSKKNVIKEPKSSSISMTDESDEEKDMGNPTGFVGQSDWDTYKKRSLSYANHELKKQLNELKQQNSTRNYSQNEGFYRDGDLALPTTETRFDKRNLVLPPKEPKFKDINENEDNHSSSSSIRVQTSKNTQSNYRLPRINPDGINKENGQIQKKKKQYRARYEDNSMELNEINTAQYERRTSRPQNNRDRNIGYY